MKLLPSKEREYKDKIRMLQEEKDMIATITLHSVTRIINTSEELTDVQKENLLKSIWKK